MCNGYDKGFYLKCITVDFRTYIDLSSSDEQWFCDGIDNASPFNFSDSFFEPANSVDVNPGTSMIPSHQHFHRTVIKIPVHPMIVLRAYR